MEKKYDAISVSAFILWQGKALVVQRAAEDNFLPGYWEQVGGKVDSGETQEEALIREVQEEAGIVIKPLHSYYQFEYTHRDGRRICEYAYLCEVVGEPIVQLSSEHQNYQWVTTKELYGIQPMSDTMREVIQKGFLS